MSGVDYSKMSEAEIDAALAANAAEPQVIADTPAPPQPKAEEPAPKETAPPAEEPPPQEEPVPSEPEEAPPSTDEIDLKAVEEEGQKIEREKWQAQLALQQAHSSRLAGELGFLRKQLESRPTATEHYQPESPEEENRLVRVERELQAEKSARIRGEVAQAIREGILALDAPELQTIQKELAEAAPKYREQLTAASEMTDPATARQIAEAVGRSMIADAKELAWSNRRKALEEKKASQTEALRARKRAASVSGGGAASTARPAPKTYEQMTDAELAAEMDKEFGVRRG